MPALLSSQLYFPVSLLGTKENKRLHIGAVCFVHTMLKDFHLHICGKPAAVNMDISLKGAVVKGLDMKSWEKLEDGQWGERLGAEDTLNTKTVMCTWRCYFHIGYKSTPLPPGLEQGKK